MQSISLTTLADEELVAARQAASAHTIHGGHQHALRQALLALAAGRSLDEHDSPGEATLQVLPATFAWRPPPRPGKEQPATTSSYRPNGTL